MEPITVYIPSYNVEQFIGPCIEHLLKQTVKPAEILVINDGSTDKTVEFAQKYPVKIIHHDKNRGLAAGRNTGVNNATHEYVASIDADCLASENWLEELMKGFTNPKVAGVGGKLIEKFDEKATDRWRALHMRQHWWDERSTNPMFLFGHSNVFRKTILLEIGGYDPQFRTNYEDVNISHRLKSNGYELIYTPQAIVYHLKRDSVYSLLKAYWRWTLFDKVEPTDFRKLLTKWRFNLGKAWYFFKMDMKNGKIDLAFIDILLIPYHSYFDWQFFRNQKVTKK